MTESKPTKAATASAEKVLAQKWGKAAISAGWTALPDVIFRYPKALGLKATDLLVILHLASYWWKANQLPWPSKARIAEAMDVDPGTVRRSIKRMEDMGYIKRIYRKAEAGDNQSNKYDLSGLVKAADALAVEEIKRREQRAAEDKQLKTTPKTFSLIAGGKKEE